MKIKKEVQDRLEKCFQDLRKAGFQVSEPPEIYIDTDKISVLGKAFPEKFITRIEVRYTVLITEKDLVIE